VIVGLTGYARSGKDTVAGILARRGYKRAAFADALKGMLLRLDPYVSFYMGETRVSDVVGRWGWEKCKESSEVCRMLQALGDGCRGYLGTDVLVQPIVARIKAGTGADWAVSDVQVPAEAEALRSLGGVIWRVTRPGTGPVNRHATETAPDSLEPDATVVNDADIEALERRVAELLAEPA
jgi:hypothetical protein